MNRSQNGLQKEGLGAGVYYLPPQRLLGWDAITPSDVDWCRAIPNILGVSGVKWGCSPHDLDNRNCISADSFLEKILCLGLPFHGVLVFFCLNKRGKNVRKGPDYPHFRHVFMRSVGCLSSPPWKEQGCFSSSATILDPIFVRFHVRTWQVGLNTFIQTHDARYQRRTFLCSKEGTTIFHLVLLIFFCVNFSKRSRTCDCNLRGNKSKRSLCVGFQKSVALARKKTSTEAKSGHFWTIIKVRYNFGHVRGPYLF